MQDSACAAQAGHIPVLLDRVLSLLAPAVESAPAGRDPLYVDATLGMGGHAEAMLQAHPRLRLIGLDRDPSAIERAGRRLARFADRVRLVHAVYDELPRVLAELGEPHAEAILFDLGVSSPQLDEAERGFAYSYDAPLDMRMDPTQPLTAADVVNGYPPEELARILREYGEERHARRIAAAIERERRRAPLRSTGRLAELVRQAIPAPARRSGGNPAKRTFQALRIEVNGELAIWERALPAALQALPVGGRVAVLSYHSLEDRITKRVLTACSTDTTPPGLPVSLPEHRPTFRLLTRGAETPGEEEITANPRAASARLRAAERIGEPVAAPAGPGGRA
ncbi:MULTISPECIES: 16S rRNA (cytosine(1402)-N(4))-methyltransferase RsmH [Thermomonospora]|uniref:Ribosomal RNA small subunit methyltransferase H n=1 Tax=Thermomonospora curvata (strain ATCC 19995 / DSM 43183 / JCM 3096 / KCTC 9072 / NBRC 15933 / NCIMB 10081 / Henssen B9) TaxID=471852 RepID=D1A7V4_THECD|nr:MULTISPECIES: 16S rRNA (cytosine(1402)-N(4))-methyltransferase RsmH [Thermomonospora]ACY98476.1 S-adenosyl-methyltransferase MraW [Thermomonospora curvata DSM 43183]PKK13622.1 MAG: 16S rRNA (cytosine(1402)-N(4))-methyltransferase RsmH [Thermomonospora sp. CIF 1]